MFIGDCRGSNRMIVICTTNVVGTNSAHGEVYSIQYYVARRV